MNILEKLNDIEKNVDFLEININPDHH